MHPHRPLPHGHGSALQSPTMVEGSGADVGGVGGAINHRFEADKQAWEDAIRGYSGNDPLDLWFNYVGWYEQNRSFDRSNNLRPILERCLSLYQDNEGYSQDTRMVKLRMKLVELQQSNPSCYQIMYKKSNGTHCQMREQPIEDLQEMHRNFRLSHVGRGQHNDSLAKKRSANTMIEPRQPVAPLSPPQKKIKHEALGNYIHQVPAGHHHDASVPPVNGGAVQEGPALASTAVVGPHRHQLAYYHQHRSGQQDLMTPNHAHMPAETPSTESSSYYLPDNHSNSTYYSGNGQHEPYQHADSFAPSDIGTTVPVSSVSAPIGHTNLQQVSTDDTRIQSDLVQQQRHREEAGGPVPNSSVATQYQTQEESVIECNLNNSAYVISSSLSYVYDDPDLSTQYPLAEEVHSSQESSEPAVSPNSQPTAEQEYAVDSDQIRLPPNFVRESRSNHETWDVPLCLEEPYDPNRRCCYPKHLVYPDLHVERPTKEFSLEEILAQRWQARKLQQQEQEAQRQAKLAQLEKEKQMRQIQMKYHQQQQQLQHEQQQQQQQQQQQHRMYPSQQYLNSPGHTPQQQPNNFQSHQMRQGSIQHTSNFYHQQQQQPHGPYHGYSNGYPAVGGQIVHQAQQQAPQMLSNHNYQHTNASSTVIQNHHQHHHQQQQQLHSVHGATHHQHHSPVPTTHSHSPAPATVPQYPQQQYAQAIHSHLHSPQGYQHPHQHQQQQHVPYDGYSHHSYTGNQQTAPTVRAQQEASPHRTYQSMTNVVTPYGSHSPAQPVGQQETIVPITHVPYAITPQTPQTSQVYANAAGTQHHHPHQQHIGAIVPQHSVHNRGNLFQQQEQHKQQHQYQQQQNHLQQHHSYHPYSHTKEQQSLAKAQATAVAECNAQQGYAQDQSKQHSAPNSYKHVTAVAEPLESATVNGVMRAQMVQGQVQQLHQHLPHYQYQQQQQQQHIEQHRQQQQQENEYQNHHLLQKHAQIHQEQQQQYQQQSHHKLQQHQHDHQHLNMQQQELQRVQQEQNQYNINNNHGKYNANCDDVEEQIEASTIRFSTPSENGTSRKQTITIKFKKEKTGLASSYTTANQHSPTAIGSGVNSTPFVEANDGAACQYSYSQSSGSKEQYETQETTRALPDTTKKHKKLATDENNGNRSKGRSVAGNDAGAKSRSSKGKHSKKKPPSTSELDGSRLVVNHMEDANLLLSLSRPGGEKDEDSSLSVQSSAELTAGSKKKKKSKRSKSANKEKRRKHRYDVDDDFPRVEETNDDESDAQDTLSKRYSETTAAGTYGDEDEDDGMLDEFYDAEEEEGEGDTEGNRVVRNDDDDDEEEYYGEEDTSQEATQQQAIAGNRAERKRIIRPDEDDSSYQSNSEFNTSFSNISFAGDNSNGPFNYGGSNCSTPARRTQTSVGGGAFSKTSTPVGSFRYLRKQETYLSNLGQNEDSMNSTVVESSFFQAGEHDEDAKKRRFEKALATIETHLSRSFVDPFNGELCRAFLTKVDFPSRNCEPTENYRLTETNLPKLLKGQTTNLGGTMYSIEKEVGRGSYGSVFRAINTQTSSVVAIKYQKPANTWELYICTEVKKRLTNVKMLAGFMDISGAVIAPNASVLVSEFSQYGSLLDINNKIRTAATRKVMHESLVMHFSCQILSIVEYLHGCNIIHADIKPDNFLLMKIPSRDLEEPTLRLIDFGCAIDMNFFEAKHQFKKVIQTDGFTCIEMQEGRPWSFQTDLFCVAGTIHVMLFGEYMQLVKKYECGWDIKQKLPRYLKKHVWTEVFQKLLNIKDIDHMPSLSDLRRLINEEAYKMDSELVTHIRSLSNLLKSR